MVKLQGTAPNQVPTNADLGSLAYVDHDTVNNITAADLRLKALSKTKSQTAVDVFVYDTSNDSDGGAWRHRTQHTSWYNEGASSTRGSRKEFPAVAVIVAESDKVTIYDGDDPSLPMWMVFDEIANYALGFDQVTGSVPPISSITSKNGTIALGQNVTGNGQGVRTINFISELILRISDYPRQGAWKFKGNIAERNTTKGGVVYNSSQYIVELAVNDVAMTVLPDAPTDPATGLPVPTIAVATDGGVSVIKDDGTVVDSAAATVSAVSIDQEKLSYFRVDECRVIAPANITSDGFTFDRRYNTGPTYSAAYLPQPLSGSNKPLLSEVISLAASSGLTQLYENTESQTKGMVAYTTSSYATGWMNGDIKLAALADTTAETLSNTLLVDDDFTTATGWTTGTGWTINTTTGEAVHDEATGAGDIYKDVTVEAGKTYLVVYDIASEPVSGGGATNTSVQVYDGTGSNLVWGVGTVKFSSVYDVFDGSLTYHKFVVPTTTNLRLRSYSDDEFSIDNISVRLADPDRSVNGNGLGVHGSVTKAAVATGADVVAYSGFTSSNYLEQPYNSDLDFGTNDFCVMGWLKTSETGNDYIVDCRNAAATVGFLVLVDANGVLYFSAQNATTGNVTGTVDVTSDTWRHFACVRSNSGTDYSIYVDGQLDATSVDTAEDVDSTDRILRVGTKVNNSLKFAGSLALLRISATAPTADQIKYIYDSERPLFQENAAATLYGSSDAVTALAHDPVTDLLHVGTSAGRSVFQGLRRVDNTTTAVSTAISANDSLIVEQ